jgi:hypothetical protein
VKPHSARQVPKPEPSIVPLLQIDRFAVARTATASAEHLPP